jgi:hypothetical protein
MKRAIIIALALPLCGCWADQKRDMAACESETRRTYPDDKELDAAQARILVATCMRGKGYFYNPFTSRCAGSTPYFELSPYCYTPDNHLGALGLKIELGLEKNSN